MNLEDEHQHDFAPEDWPFAEEINAVAFVQKKVRDGKPIMTIFHDHEGDWQFFHEDIGPNEEPSILCLGCVFETDSSIGEVADMPAGCMANRDSVGGEWEIEEYEDVEDDEDEDEDEDEHYE